MRQDWAWFPFRCFTAEGLWFFPLVTSSASAQYRVQHCINNSVLTVSPLNANPLHASWIGINHFGKHIHNLYCPPLPLWGVKGAGAKIARFCKVPSWKWKPSFSLQGEKDMGDSGGFGLPEDLPAVVSALLHALLNCHMLTLFVPGHFTISLVRSQNWGLGNVTANNVILFKLCACVSAGCLDGI